MKDDEQDAEGDGGIARRVPIFAFFFVLIALASAGMPALSGFPGEFLVLLGTFNAGAPLDAQVSVAGAAIRSHQVFAVVAASGVILAAVYLLWMLQKVLFGPLQHTANAELADMNGREIAVMAPLAVMALLMGVVPGLFLEAIEPSAQRFVSSFHQRASLRYEPDPGAKRIGVAEAPLQLPRLRVLPQRFPMMPRGVIDRPPMPPMPVPEE